MVVDCKSIAEKIKSNVRKEILENNYKVKLAVILVGDDPASKVYVRNKSIACEKTNIEYEEYLLPENISQNELEDLINKLNNDNEINGILLQSPIPKHLNIEKAFNLISDIKDVDGFNIKNIGKLQISDKTGFVPCTPSGIMNILEEIDEKIEGKKVVILGRSNIVGKPISMLMLEKNATITICHSKTKNIESELKKADIIIMAIGKAEYLKENMIKDDVILIDVGINRREDGKLVGDIDFENCLKKAKYITPVPGGVGQLTVAKLMENTLKAYKIQNNMKGN